MNKQFKYIKKFQSGGTAYHTVSSGDTLTKIAKQYGLTLKQLIALNPNINPDRININQQIRISDKKTNGEVAKEHANSYLYKPNWNNLEQLYNYYVKKFGPKTSAAIVANIAKESGGDPNRKQLGGGPGRGLLQWEIGSDRYGKMQGYTLQDPNIPGMNPELQRQAEYIYSTTVKNPYDKVSWLRGQSKYSSGEEARQEFMKASKSIGDKSQILTQAYIRPQNVKEAFNRRLLAEQIDSIYNPNINKYIY